MPAGTGSIENPVSQNYEFEARGPAIIPSRVVDPPDGKIPYQPWALAWRNQQTHDRDHPTRPEHYDSQQQCMTAPPRLLYATEEYRLIQPRGFVVFVWTRYHQFRVIPLDQEAYPRPGPNLKLWMGFTRGRWDGNTLVVETFNQNGKSRLTSAGDFLTDNVKYTERYTFLDADTITYEVTIDDPSEFTRPWTMRVRQRRHNKDEEIWEEGCPEGIEVERGLFDTTFRRAK